jgi:uncharacterized protein YhaN
MSIFARVTDIFKANVNDMLDKMEDPEKMVKQMIIEMEEGLVKATSSLAKAMANERDLRKQCDGAAAQAKQWEEKAALALKAGNADLAKQALSKKLVYDGQVKQYESKVGPARCEKAADSDSNHCHENYLLKAAVIKLGVKLFQNVVVLVGVSRHRLKGAQELAFVQVGAGDGA